MVDVDPSFVKNHGDSRRLVHKQTDTVHREVGEAGRLGGQLVGAGRQLFHCVAPLAVRLIFAHQAGFRVDNCYDGVGYDGARRVRDRSRQGSGLRKQARRQGCAQHKYPYQFFHL